MGLVEALDAVVPTPPEHRVWIDEAEALSTLRCSPADLKQLVSAGLVFEDGRYENYDVWNVGLLSGSGMSRPEREMIFFARVLKSFRADWVSSRTYEVFARAECPLGAACPEPDWVTPRLPVIEWREQETGAGFSAWRGLIELGGGSATVQDPRVRDRWQDLLERFRFHFTPATLALDVARTVERGVGDCDALSRVLMNELLDLGIPAAVEPGYIFGGARLRRHSWLRITDSDGEPKTLDAGMAILARTFFTPEYESFCFGSRLNRVIPLACHEDVFAPHPCVEGPDRIFYEIVLHPVASQRAVQRAVGTC